MLRQNERFLEEIKTGKIMYEECTYLYFKTSFLFPRLFSFKERLIFNWYSLEIIFTFKLQGFCNYYVTGVTTALVSCQFKAWQIFNYKTFFIFQAQKMFNTK